MKLLIKFWLRLNKRKRMAKEQQEANEILANEGYPINNKTK